MKRDGRAQARSGKEIIAWEFRTPSGWFANPTPLLTVLDPDRTIAVQYVYSLGRTTGDVDCGHIDLVPIRRRDAQALGWSDS